MPTPAERISKKIKLDVELTRDLMSFFALAQFGQLETVLMMLSQPDTDPGANGTAESSISKRLRENKVGPHRFLVLLSEINDLSHHDPTIKTYIPALALLLRDRQKDPEEGTSVENARELKIKMRQLISDLCLANPDLTRIKLLELFRRACLIRQLNPDKLAGDEKLIATINLFLSGNSIREPRLYGPLLVDVIPGLVDLKDNDRIKSRLIETDALSAA